MIRKAYFIFAALIVVNALMVAVAGAASEAPRMSKEELKSRLSDKNIVLIDVRTDRDWTRSDSKIKGAVREDPVNVATWAKKYPKDKTIVLYCAWHNEATSARVALQLIEMGFPRVYALKGGWSEWEKEKYPMEKKWIHQIPHVPGAALWNMKIMKLFRILCRPSCLPGSDTFTHTGQCSLWNPCTRSAVSRSFRRKLQIKCYLDALDHQYALIRLDLTSEFGRPPDAISRAFPARLRTRVMRKRLAHVFGGAQAGITGAIGGRPLVEAKRMSSLKLILESFLVEPPPTGFI